MPRLEITWNFSSTPNIFRYLVMFDHEKILIYIFNIDTVTP